MLPWERLRRLAPWRRVLRDVVSIGAVLAFVAALTLFAWMTRRPEAAFFEQATGWPVVGPLVERLREPWLVESAIERARRSREIEGYAAVAEDRTGEGKGEEAPTESIFLGGGALLRADPEEAAPELMRTRLIRRVAMLDRQGSWAQVSLGDPEGNPVVGWVDLDAPREYDPPLGNAPMPPKPVTGRSPDPDRLAAALSLLGERRTGRLGPYPLHHDLEDDRDNRALLERLDRSAALAEPYYRRRYGVEPVGAPAAEIVLFARRRDYVDFQNRSRQLRGMESSGHLSEGLIAIWTEDTPVRDVELTLLHEITHLLDRRALGPALPPWLGEGMAEEFSELGFALENGRERAERLAEFRTTLGNIYELRGPLASLDQLLTAGGSGRFLPLEQLMAEDWNGFVRDPDVTLRYGESGWFLHWLLEDSPARADALRRFLAGVAQGEAPSGEILRQELEAPWRVLNAEFRAWLAVEGVRAGL